MVEFALLLPVLLTLLLAILQFGIAFNTQLALQAAAREGARAAALGQDEAAVTATIQDAADPHDLEVAEGDVIDLSRAHCPDPGDPLDDAEAVVELEKQITFSIPLLDPGVTLSARGVMRCGA